MLSKLASRKLWVALGAIATMVIAAVSGEVAWADAVYAIASVAGAYCVSQGWVDGRHAAGAVGKLEPFVVGSVPLEAPPPLPDA